MTVYFGRNTPPVKYMARIQSLYIIFDRELLHYFNESEYKSRHKLLDYAEMIMRNSRGRFLDTSKVSSLNSRALVSVRAQWSLEFLEL